MIVFPTISSRKRLVTISTSGSSGMAECLPQKRDGGTEGRRDGVILSLSLCLSVSLSLTIRREDRNGETCARCEGQLVQIAALIEGASRARRARVEVDGDAQDGLIIVRVKLQPTAPPRGHEGVEARSDAREVIRDARPALARLGAEDEAHADLGVVIADAG